jgi:hypothetical protein
LQSSRPEARPGHIAARPAEIGKRDHFQSDRRRCRTFSRVYVGSGSFLLHRPTRRRCGMSASL